MDELNEHQGEPVPAGKPAVSTVANRADYRRAGWRSRRPKTTRGRGRAWPHPWAGLRRSDAVDRD